MKVKFVLDKGYPHGEVTEIMDYDDDTPTCEINDDLYDWVLAQTRCHFEVVEP